MAGRTYASWTFRKAEKFFDVVNFSGSAAPTTISHNLGVVPGMIIVKRTSAASDWWVWHTSIPNNALALNTTQNTSTYNAPQYVYGDGVSVIQPTDADFTIYTGNSGTYVAYLFASDAGGFGDDGSESIIKCGSFAHNFSGATVNCGFEPQWILVKAADQANNWYIFDVMRGIVTGGSGGDGDAALFPNTSGAENVNTWGIDVNATGFTVYGNNILSSGNAIYIAIRRPMKTPESGTEVFSPSVFTDPSVATTTGFPVDMFIQQGRNTDSNALLVDRMRGSKGLVTQQTSAENAYWSPSGVKFDDMDGVLTAWPVGATSYAGWAFKRATGFMDVVAYSGTGVQNHNLGVKPEMVIYKARSTTLGWGVDLTNHFGYLNTNAALISTSVLASRATETTWNPYLSAGADWIAYLFATLAGVSKVGSYTGDGTTDGSKVIDCGFSTGARFILIKRTDSSGNWLVMDSVRGITTSNDPILKLNSAGAEQLGDSVYPAASGFGVVEAGGSNSNTSGASYIFLAIA